MEGIAELPELFIKNHPEQAAKALEKIPAKEAGEFIKGLDPEVAGRVIVYLTPEQSRIIIEKIPPKFRASLVNPLPAHHAAIILRKLSKKNRNRILQGVSEKNNREIQLLLKYEEGTVGAIMDSSMLVFAEDQPVKECLQLIKEKGQETCFYYYVLLRGGQVKGIVNLFALVKADQQNEVGILATAVKYLISGHTEIPSILNNEELETYGQLPVIDEQGLFNGVVTREKLQPFKQDNWESSFNATASSLGEVFLLGISGMVQGFDKINKGG